MVKILILNCIQLVFFDIEYQFSRDVNEAGSKNAVDPRLSVSNQPDTRAFKRGTQQSPLLQCNGLQHYYFRLIKLQIQLIPFVGSEATVTFLKNILQAKTSNANTNQS